MKDEQLLYEVHEKAKGMEFSARWLVLELAQRYEQAMAEVERLKAVANAELDTIHALGDDYERALEAEQELVRTTRANAIHEFAGILRSECRQDQFGFYYIIIDHITHLEKLLTENVKGGDAE